MRHAKPGCEEAIDVIRARHLARLPVGEREIVTYEQLIRHTV
jgi:hypothetical protein